jgi:CMP-N-acetylneuraminic acid synthetase
MTHTTNPLLSAQTVQSMLSVYDNREHEYDSVVAVTNLFGRFMHRDGSPMNHNPSKLLRTQDLEPVLFENSCGYVFSKESFFSTKSRIGARPLHFETPKLESVDIDEEADWIVAEALGKFWRSNAYSIGNRSSCCESRREIFSSIQSIWYDSNTSK